MENALTVQGPWWPLDLLYPCPLDPHTLCAAMALSIHCVKALSWGLSIQSLRSSSKKPWGRNNTPTLQMRKQVQSRAVTYPGHSWVENSPPSESRAHAPDQYAAVSCVFVPQSPQWPHYFVVTAWPLPDCLRTEAPFVASQPSTPLPPVLLAVQLRANYWTSLGFSFLIK